MKSTAENHNPISCRQLLQKVSFKPGVYLMKNAEGVVIYVGKAGNLKKRLSSYFNKSMQMEIKTSALVKKISTFDTIITNTEKEAVILEANLIKQYKPRYNIILKDDKEYPSLRLDIKKRYPTLSIARKIKKDGSLYFGPFVSSQSVRQAIKIINKAFRLRKCRGKIFKTRSRPCLNYQMQRCLAPCCCKVDKKVYDEIVKEVILFLKGRTPELIKKIKNEMMYAANMQDYEKAALLRDKVFALEKILEKQIAVTTDFKDRDIIATAKSPEASIITLLSARGGYLLGSRHFNFPAIMSNDSEMIKTFIRQHYEKKRFIPKEILIPISIEDSPFLEEWLESKKGEKVSILQPQRGDKARLVEMAVQNAQSGLKDMIDSIASDKDLLVRLQKRLRMNSPPFHIECFDNSNISGTEPVASMVVFKNGKAINSLYRKYKIKTVLKQDDYAYMAEILKRRFGKSSRQRFFPDLLMVDGGKGQLNIAVSVIKELKIEKKIEIIGIAKKDEKKGETEDKIIKPEMVNPVSFGKDKDLLFFLQKIRDEAHRFAIIFHRTRRSSRSMQSLLDAIPGIGEKRKKILLKHFGGIKNIEKAELEELSGLTGMNRKVARVVHKYLREAKSQSLSEHHLPCDR